MQISAWLFSETCSLPGIQQAGSQVKILPRSPRSPVLLLPPSRRKHRGYGKKLPLSLDTLHNGHFLRNANSLRKGLAVSETARVRAGAKLRKWKTFQLHIDRDAKDGGAFIFSLRLFEGFLPPSPRSRRDRKRNSKIPTQAPAFLVRLLHVLYANTFKTNIQ